MKTRQGREAQESIEQLETALSEARAEADTLRRSYRDTYRTILIHHSGMVETLPGQHVVDGRHMTRSYQHRTHPPVASYRAYRDVAQLGYDTVNFRFLGSSASADIWVEA